jgi:Methyltransferase domain
MNIDHVLSEAFRENKIIQVTLSQPRHPGIKKITIRPIQVRLKLCFQVTEEKGDKAFHFNLSADVCIQRMKEEWISSFKQVVFFVTDADYHMQISKQHQMTIKRKKPTKSQGLIEHNRSKQYLLQDTELIPFLVELGVMSSERKIIPSKYHKYRQINKFLEFIDDILPYFTREKPLRIIDFGCGKAYLTFALYHYLHIVKGFDLNITGLDLKAEVVAFCRGIAVKLGWNGLEFIQGDIEHYTEKNAKDCISSFKFLLFKFSAMPKSPISYRMRPFSVRHSIFLLCRSL